MAFLLPSILVQGIYTGIIGTISSVTMSTCALAKTVYTHENPNVNRIIKSIDIERRLRLVTAVIRVINEDTKETVTDLEKTLIIDLVKTSTPSVAHPGSMACCHLPSCTQAPSSLALVLAKQIPETPLAEDPIELCLSYLHETIRDIRADLLAINRKVAYHNTKWFSSWRTLDVSSYLSNLKTNAQLLNQRFDDLTKISAFLKQRREHIPAPRC